MDFKLLVFLKELFSNLSNIPTILIYTSLQGFFLGKILFGSSGSCLVSWLPLPYIGIAKYSDKCDLVITAEIKLENC